jgi:two-component system chemotaxis sensor kinase CheA
MDKLLATLLLPPEITDFERRHLARMNRIGLGFFALHVPALALLAYFNDTGVGLAIVLSVGVLAGPALAYRVFSNPRVMSLTYGFTAMLMGGLLVHFGQGPVQIEMHFYFFALLAMLVLFGNPMSIVVAAVTVAVHHLLLWLVLPSSVFNYEAPVWVVAVHAAFVVLESIAACFIARSFFDNVIGLEKIVKARTTELDSRNAAMRLVLDNVQQGLLMIDRGATVAAERSAIVEDWLGAIGESTGFADLLRRGEPSAAAWFEVGWSEVVEGTLPLELTLAQLPTKLSIGDRRLAFTYIPIQSPDETLEKVLVVISDITLAMERERIAEEQRELLALFDRLLSDRRGVKQFLEEGSGLVQGIVEGEHPDLPVLKRGLHTLKGNAGIFGVGSIATMCHELETHVEETQEPLPDTSRDALATRWNALREHMRPLLGEHRVALVEIDETTVEHLLAALHAGRPREEIAREVESWQLEPTSVPLRRVADQARRIADRLGKPAPHIDIADHGVRLRPEPWSGFWSAFIHVVRNAVDHGIEAPDVRVERGKPAAGRISLATYVDGTELVIAIEDDGPGIDLTRLGEAAARIGLAPTNDHELVHAIFHDGVTTSDRVGEFSGRGVGMGAIRTACAALGGRVVPTTRQGGGTRIEFRIPAATATAGTRAA